MTSEHIKQVREAATLLLRWHVGGIESDESHPWDGMDYDDLNYEKAEAVKVVCGFALSLVGTDGELPVTEEWLREEWGAVGNHKGCEILIPEECINGFDWRLVATTAPSWKGSYWFLEREVNHVIRLPFANPTRYQFRLLAAALGIKRKGE